MSTRQVCSFLTAFLICLCILGWHLPYVNHPPLRIVQRWCVRDCIVHQPQLEEVEDLFGQDQMQLTIWWQQSSSLWIIQEIQHLWEGQIHMLSSILDDRIFNSENRREKLVQDVCHFSVRRYSITIFPFEWSNRLPVCCFRPDVWVQLFRFTLSLFCQSLCLTYQGCYFFLYSFVGQVFIILSSSLVWTFFLFHDSHFIGLHP